MSNLRPLTEEEKRYWQIRHHAASERLKLPQFRQPICKSRPCVEKECCQQPWACVMSSTQDKTVVDLSGQ